MAEVVLWVAVVPIGDQVEIQAGPDAIWAQARTRKWFGSGVSLRDRRRSSVGCWADGSAGERIVTV